MICKDCALFEQKLAFHTAPALLGIKPSNLMSLDKEELDIYGNAESFNRRAAEKGLKIKILCDCGKRCLVLLYNEHLMKNMLSEKDRRRMLERFGYERSCGLEECLDRLASRTQVCLEFPHEIGLFLGYPVGDVQGFISNHGQGFKLCGYWKVYSDADRARRIFKNYDKCRAFLCNKLEQGYDIYQALKIS